MDAVKTERIEGTVLLADSRAGKVTSDFPLRGEAKLGGEPGVFAMNARL